MDMRAFCPIVKPLLDNVVSEASHIQNLTEALSSGYHKQARQENHIQPSGSLLHSCLGDIHLEKTTIDQQPSISSNHATLLSDIGSLKRELSDVQLKHQNIVQELNQSIHSAQCGISNSKLILPQKMQLFKQEQQVSNGKVLCPDQKLTGNLTPEKNVRDNIQALDHTVEILDFKEQTGVKTLRMQIAVFEEKITSLQRKLRASDEKLHSLQEKLFYSEQKIQFMQARLINSNDRAFYLEEAIMSAEDVVQSQKKALLESETRATTAKIQLEFLQEQNMEHQNSVQKMSESLGASEELWKRVPEMGMSLEHYKRQVDILQHALNRAESMHKEEMEQLASKMEKQAIHQQNLQNEVLDLSKKLLQERLQMREDLIGSVKYEEHVQDPMQEARQGARKQSDSQCYDMDNLSKRRQVGSTEKNILQHDMHGSRQTPELDMGERPLQACLSSLLKEFMELRGNINTVLKDHEESDNQKRWDWMKVQEQSQEWERRAGKLVDSLYYFQNHQMLGNKGGLSDGTDMASHTGKPSIHHSPEVMPYKEDIRHHSWPQNAHRPDLVNNKQCQFHLPNGFRYSDSTLDLTVQKHYKDFLREGFHGNTQGSQRMP